MAKKLIALLLCVLSASALAGAACPQAVPTNDPGFCPSFASVAACHCLASNISPEVCNNMTALYAVMLARYTTLERACSSQQDTSTQNCIDDWNCYRNGGKDSQGRLCSGTGKSC